MNPTHPESESTIRPAPLPEGPLREELSQAKARFGVCLFAFLYMGAWTWFSGPIQSSVVWAVAGYLVFSAAWIALVSRRPGQVPWRRLVVIIGDLGINTFFMHTLQEKGAFFYPFYLWIIVGNGVRFGARYLLLAMTVGVLYFTPMLIFSPYWRSNWVAGSGLLAGMVILPMFYLSLIKHLHAANERLQHEAERAQAAARAKTEFLSNMSHELRTPMSGVLGVAQLMRRTPLDETQERYLDLMQRSANSLLRIIDDILDFARIDAGKILLERSPFHLETVVEDVVHLLEPRAEEKGLELRLQLPAETPGTFLGDATRIRQILFNLLGNAVKFTDTGHISIAAEHRPLPDGRFQIRLRIVDTGPGIPPDKLDLIFEKFERAETRIAQKIGGSGLGLAISRRLAHMMEGEVTVRSEVGRGTTFVATMILEPGDETRPDERSFEQGGQREFALDALVVEDNPVNQLVTCSLLEEMGISATLAENGEIALDRWRTQPFDLILMDVRLPVLDGLEATRRIRAEEGDGHHIAILAMTANASPDDAEACLDAGMDLFLAKPVDLAQLEAAVQALEERGLVHPGIHLEPRKGTQDSR